jgi:hypothetical protein
MRSACQGFPLLLSMRPPTRTPLHRLRDEAARLYANAHRDLLKGDTSQDTVSVAAIREARDRFQAWINKLDRHL